MYATLRLPNDCSAMKERCVTNGGSSGIDDRRMRMQRHQMRRGGQIAAPMSS
ncbi:hypothetical protein RE6C_02528 [Rhodopirellula europaea 6C]|uniref:Uncharacterized protein n=1 Tax=Rhodopirellula europaea 6C TaxID=1263867 RepID=M2B4P7_9BACT|nr:hypothetical protein RE6C_02528 [Rhodopirellula europaea 6C]